MTHDQKGFTFSEQIRLIIVCDDKGKPHANYLQQLISRGEVQVESAIYTSKQYIDNRPKLSSNQYILFVGLSAAAKEHLDTVTEECKVQDAYMIYGWNGKRGVLYVDPSFKKFPWKEIVSITTIALIICKMLFLWYVMPPTQRKKEIERELYKELVKKFYEKGLKSFMKLS